MDPVLPFFLNQSPGMLRESKNLQKILDTKRVGERLKLLSESS